MQRLALVGLLLAACGDDAAAPPPRTGPPLAPKAVDIETKARRIVELLARGEHAAVTASFDETMTGAMPVATLTDTWNKVLAGAGIFLAVERTDLRPVQEFRVVTVTCKMEKTRIGIELAFDRTDRVSGFFLVPPKDDYGDPAYVDRAKFEERDVTVGSGDLALPGTLALPRGPGPFPAVVLVHGSGPNDRDETIGANRPFKDLAGGLATRGIAVLRYDKRTKIHAAKITPKLGSFTVEGETVDDAVLAVTLLATTPSIDPKRIVVAGHSLGGQLAPRIAQRTAKVRAIAILAGSTRSVPDMMIEQMTYIAKLDGTETPLEAEQIAKVVAARDRLTQILGGGGARAGETILGAGVAYWRDLARYDALAAAKRLARPIFVAQGGRDYQVTTVDFDAWKAALAGRTDVELHLYPELNHAFGAGTGPSAPREYDARAPVDVRLIDDLAAWIGKL